MAKSIGEVLLAHGPCLSSELSQLLVNSGITPQAARKQISRAKGDVRRLHSLPFPKNSRFFYHKSDHESERYWRALLHAAIEKSPAYGPALAALKARSGIAPKDHFSILSGAPWRQKGQLSAETILTRLIRVGLVVELDVPGVGPCVRLRLVTAADTSELKARLITEGILLLVVKNWIRKLAIVSYDKVAVRGAAGPMPQVGTFNWDIAGPSYLAALARRKKGEKAKPGFFVCDVILGNTVDQDVMEAFLRKCRTVRMLKNIAPIISMVLADEFTAPAFRRGREEGVIAATPDILFGRDVADSLKALMSALKNAAQMTPDSPAVFNELFGKLGHIEGAAGNLRGALFELIVGHLVREIEGGEVSFGQKYNDPTTLRSAEADVVLNKNGQSVTFFECKGHQPTELVNDLTVTEWLHDKIPVIYNTAQTERRYRNLKFRFEFWTCGTFSPEAKNVLDQAARTIVRYQIAYKDGAEVRTYAAKQAGSSIRKTLEEHYFNHPMKRIAVKTDRLRIQQQK